MKPTYQAENCPRLDAIKAELSVLRMGVVASGGGLKVKVGDRGRLAKFVNLISESVILEGIKTNGEGDCLAQGN